LTGALGRVYKPRQAGPRRPVVLFLGAARVSPPPIPTFGVFFSMANTSSAKKAVRKITRRTAVNKSRRSQMRTYLRVVEEAIAARDAKAAAVALHEAEPLLARAAQKGIVHKNAASRKISRLTKRVNALAG